MKDDTISRQAAIDAVNELTKWYLETYHETRPTTVAVIDRLTELPSAEPEHMHTVMQKIKEKYEKAMNTPSCISNPMAWALYQTWKEYAR